MMTVVMMTTMATMMTKMITCRLHHASKARRDRRKELKGNLAAQNPGLGTLPPERYCPDLSDREVLYCPDLSLPPTKVWIMTGIMDETDI